MLHLITVEGKSARKLYLRRKLVPDFKSLLRTVTSGRVMVIPTKFRSDLIYYGNKAENKSIVKLWALYAHVSLSTLHRKDFSLVSGDERSLSRYFQSIHKLSTNWYYYRLYRKAFHHTFNNDQNNPITEMVLQCDLFLAKNKVIKRAPLKSSSSGVDTPLMNDTFSLVMRTLSNDTRTN